MLRSQDKLTSPLRRLLPHMGHVTEQRETLNALVAVWDMLNLLGQLSGTTTEMGGTKAAFANLTSALLSSLAQTTYDKRVQELSAQAQVAIDILVRNLFERTADIGFLALDETLRDYAAGLANPANPADATLVAARLRAYVGNYSVYRDVILLDPAGRVLARLLGSHHALTTSDALLGETLGSQQPYLEHYGASDLFPGAGACLLYTSRVADRHGAALGALYLCFDFDNEMQRIFASLARPGDWSVITLLDAGGRVIASSDPYQIAPGAQLALAPGAGQVVRFAGRSYLAVRRAAQGFQGYFGPGWSALALVPLELAFLHDDEAPSDEPAPRAGPAAASPGALADPALVRLALASGRAFPAELRQIPLQAEDIQRELNRSVWNANIRQRLAGQAGAAPGFSKVLLGEIVQTGERMKAVFTRSINDLQNMVVAAQLDDCRFLAALAMDILDRNLYERANDCRWWALDPMLCTLLAQPARSAAEQAQLGARLAAINDLYTVYDSLLLFDSAGVVVAVSRPAVASWLGRRLEAPWCAAALALRDAERYVASEFTADALYGGRPTYIYAAALRGANARPAGGIAIVFDSAPQIDAMLVAALPQAPGGLALFVDALGKVVASTDARWPAGASMTLPAELLAAPEPGGTAQLFVLDGQVMAGGAVRSAGYREYAGTTSVAGQPLLALVCVPLADYDAPALPAAAAASSSSSSSSAAAQRALAPPVATAAVGDTLDIASFQVGSFLLGVPSAAVVEAIPFTGFVRLPNTAGKLFGATVYRGDTMLIYDLHSALGVPLAADEAAPRTMLTVVLADAHGRHYGVLVDWLGDILTVGVAQIAPVERVMLGANKVLASIVMPGGGADGRPMMSLLSLEYMAAMVRAG